MDYLEGIPVESLAGCGIDQRRRNEIGSRLQELVFRELFEFRTMQSDPNFANYLYQPDSGKIVLRDFGRSDLFARAKRLGIAMSMEGMDSLEQYAVPPMVGSLRARR